MEGNRPLLLASASLIGIFLLSYASDYLGLRLTDFGEINSNRVNEVVHIRGRIEEIKKYDEAVKMVLEDDKERMLTVFVYGFKERIKAGMCADVMGEVKTHEGMLEVVPKKPEDVILFFC
jgi:RecJ-like exonuclease